MPFRMKLKTSRHYNVVSKSLFVISVEILDATVIECTLSSESTGQDCLDVVCQKLGLNQPKFFGLQYLCKNKKNVFSWIDLERPIKKQLDKYACGLYVYLRVMYYIVSGVNPINDEVTRYHYFLQLKMDVIDGRISCTNQQAVELASYCMQAEFGNYDAERHTADYLKDFQLFPKKFTEPHILESLTDAASRQHAVLYNLPPGVAEEYYISACQKLEGYGQELYMVKDEEGKEAVLGISLTGVSVTYYDNRQPKYFRWLDIRNVVNHKKYFSIEPVNDARKLSLQFPDVESAKNAWKFCVLQHTFFRQNEDIRNNESVTKPPAVTVQAFKTDDRPSPSDECDNVTPDMHLQTYREHQIPVSQYSLNKSQSSSCLDISRSREEMLKNLLPPYRPAPDYDTAIKQKYQNASDFDREPAVGLLYNSQSDVHQRYSDIPQSTDTGDIFKNFHGSAVLLNENDRLRFDEAFYHVRKAPPPYPCNKVSSNSTPDLAGISRQSRLGLLPSIVVSGSSPDLVSADNLYLKHCLREQYHPVHRSHSYLPRNCRTYENLSTILKNTPQQAIIFENPNITKHIRKIYDETGNVIYCMPNNMKQILQENQLPNTGYIVAGNQSALLALDPAINNSTEPIYENIPFPRQNDNLKMRIRTQSIHSAPEIRQVVNQSIVNSLQSRLKDIELNTLNRRHRENLYANVNNSVLSLPSVNIESYNDRAIVTNINNNDTVANSPVSSFNKDATSSDLSNTLSTSSKVNGTYAGNLSNSMTGEFENSAINSSLNSSDKSDSSTLKPKKKRWEYLIERIKSNEKVKFVPQGRDDSSKNHIHKHQVVSVLPNSSSLLPSSSKESMCHQLENKLADGQLFLEFDTILKKKLNSDFSTALHPDNAVFNRFRDVLPYEENRVRLTPTKDNKFGYINASHISMTISNKQKFYIAAQGPISVTLSYFWQCVWESEVYLIVQLTDLTENCNYLPEENGEGIDIGKDYRIWKQFSQMSDKCITSKIRILKISSRSYRTIWHLHYTDWDDQGCPVSLVHFLRYLEEMQSIYQHSMTEIPPGHNRNPPILVHCTAGVGRTGLVILCDILLHAVDHNEEICIPHLVANLRQQRAYMIQTVAQYRFVHSILIHHLKQTRLI